MGAECNGRRAGCPMGRRFPASGPGPVKVRRTNKARRAQRAESLSRPLVTGKAASRTQTLCVLCAFVVNYRSRGNMPQVLLEFVLTAGTPRQPIVIIPARFGLHPPARQAPGRHPWRAHDRACLAAGGRGRHGPVLVACGELAMSTRSRLPAVRPSDAAGPSFGLRPHLRSAAEGRSRGPSRCGRQPAGRCADRRSADAPRRARPARRRRRRHRHHRHPDPVGGGARQSQHGQGGGLVLRDQDWARPLLQPAARALG